MRCIKWPISWLTSATKRRSSVLHHHLESYSWCGPLPWMTSCGVYGMGWRMMPSQQTQTELNRLKQSMGVVQISRRHNLPCSGKEKKEWNQQREDEICIKKEVCTQSGNLWMPEHVSNKDTANSYRIKSLFSSIASPRFATASISNRVYVYLIPSVLCPAVCHW